MTLVFLPPGGAPPPPAEDDYDEDEDALFGRGGRSDDSVSSTDPGMSDASVGNGYDDSGGDAGNSRGFSSGSSVDQVLGDTSPEYDTWVSRNRSRSLAAVRGRSEVMVGAEELNEASMNHSDRHLQRLRHVLAPDEAFGAIFTWDVVMTNARDLELAAWRKVAEEEGLAPVDMDDMLRAEAMAPEAAVQRVFYWSSDWGEIKRLLFRKGEVYENLQSRWRYTISPGVDSWLSALDRHGIKSVLCAPRELEAVQETVRQVGLEPFFKTGADLVTVEDEYESLEQMYLMASIKLERPPAKCVVFTDKPAGITAGREVSSRVVAVVGAHPAYEIKSADSTISSFADLVIYHVRSLFSTEGVELMDPETELEMEVKLHE